MSNCGIFTKMILLDKKPLSKYRSSGFSLMVISIEVNDSFYG